VRTDRFSTQILEGRFELVLTVFDCSGHFRITEIDLELHELSSTRVCPKFQNLPTTTSVSHAFHLIFKELLPCGNPAIPCCKHTLKQ
jgi:hypothetical protein